MQYSTINFNRNLPNHDWRNITINSECEKKAFPPTGCSRWPSCDSLKTRILFKDTVNSISYLVCVNSSSSSGVSSSLKENLFGKDSSSNVPVGWDEIIGKNRTTSLRWLIRRRKSTTGRLFIKWKNDQWLWIAYSSRLMKIVFINKSLIENSEKKPKNWEEREKIGWRTWVYRVLWWDVHVPWPYFPWDLMLV